MAQHRLEAPVAIQVVWKGRQDPPPGDHASPKPPRGEAAELADAIFTVFRNDVTQLQGGLGIPVFFYSQPRHMGSEVPRDLRLDAAHRHVVILLVDEALIDAVDAGTGWAGSSTRTRTTASTPAPTGSRPCTSGCARAAASSSSARPTGSPRPGAWRKR